MKGELRALVDRLFSVVAAQCPTAWSAVHEASRGLSIGVEIGEAFGVEWAASGPRTCARRAHSEVRIISDIGTLRALVFGQREVLSALEGEQLQVYAAPADLIRLDDFVRWLVAGAARAPDAAALADELVALAEARGETGRRR